MRAAARIAAGAIWAACLGAAATARASVEDTVGLGPRAIALGGSYAARPGDFAATYYNPAGLSPGGKRADRGGFFELTAGAIYARPTLHVTGEDGQELSTPQTPDTAGLLLGSRFSLGQPFGIDGLNGGLSLYLPRRLFRWTIVPDDDLSWAMLTDRTLFPSLHAGVALRVTDWLSVGAGLRVLFDVETLTRGRVTDTSSATDPETGKGVVRTRTELGVHAKVFGRVSPLAGILLTPDDTLRFGLSYRHESLVDDWGYTRITGVPGLGNLGYNHRFAHYYEPSQATAAASATVAEDLELSFDLTFSDWSRGLSTNHDSFGSGRFGDTWTPALGASWQALPALRLLGGYRFVRSPIDNLGGPTNLLDNDRHVPSIGAELHLGRLLGARELDASVGWALAYHVLVTRDEHKDFRRFENDADLESNPGYPGYTHGGHLLAASLAAEARW